MKRFIGFYIVFFTVIFLICCSQERSSSANRYYDDETDGSSTTNGGGNEVSGTTSTTVALINSAQYFWGTWVKMSDGAEYVINETNCRYSSISNTFTSSTDTTLTVSDLGTFTKQSDSVMVMDSIPYYRKGGANLEYSIRVVGFTDSRSGGTVGQADKRVTGKSHHYASYTSETKTDSEGVARLIAPTVNDIQTVTVQNDDGESISVSNLKIEKSGANMGTIALVGKDQYNLKVTGTIDESCKTDGYMFVNTEYPMMLTITNISDIPATTSILTIESDNPAVTVVSKDNENLSAMTVGTLTGGTKILNLGVTCSDIDAAHIDAGIKVTIENVAADQIWVDYVPMRFYRQTVFFTVKALSSDNNDDAELKGFIIYPDGNSQYFSVGNNQCSTIEVPEFGDDEPYLMAFCGATPNSGLYSTEMYYTVICGQHPLDINLSESGTQLAEYILFGEPNNSQPTAHSVTSAFQAYLHAEDIDYYRVTAAMDKDLHLIHYIDAKNVLHSDNPIMFRENEDIVLKNASLTGYTFNGWYDASTDGNKVTGWTANTYTNDVTLYARWTANSYTVVFNANGGTGTMDSQSMTYDDSAVLPLNEFTKDNYVFKGWTTSADGEIVYTDKQNVKNLTVGNGATVTLYAVWSDTGIMPNGNMMIRGEECKKTSFQTVIDTTTNITCDLSSGVFLSVRGGVTIAPYSIGKYEVTQQLYTAVMGSNPSYYTETQAPLGDGETSALLRPVEQVSWYDAITFCNKLSTLMGKTRCYKLSDGTYPENFGPRPTSTNVKWNNAICDWTADGYRLPTECEWECAARGGTYSTTTPWTYTYSGSNTVDDVAWYWGNYNRHNWETGLKSPNSLGIYDMSGNVNEWCWDNYNTEEINRYTPVTGPATNSSLSSSSLFYRSSRGGSWNYNPEDCKVSSRGFGCPYNSYSYCGFRLACSVR